MDPRRWLGNKGERLAEKFLLDQGYKILERQWRCSFGEVDLICRDASKEIVFVEVKTRASIGAGYPEESVTREKLQHILRTAEAYLTEKHLAQSPFRIDVVAIVTYEGKEPEFLHLKGV